MHILISVLATVFCLQAMGSIENFVRVPKGTLRMGSPLSEPRRGLDEGPIQKVKIPKAFEIQATEITQQQWVDVMGHNPSYFKEKRFCETTYSEGLCPDLPVDNISWVTAQKFIEVLNSKNSFYKYRLPTESEWEWAARGGTNTTYFFGNSDRELKYYAWYDEDYELGQTHPVGTKLPNQYGLYDVYGNVHEWTEEMYSFYPGSDLDPIPVESRRTCRGGDWFSQSWRLRSAFRGATMAGDYNEMLGFRLIREKR